MKIKNQLLWTHGLLVVLALLIVFINILAYRSMENDANIVNQAGKLRMLSYNMAQLSNRLVQETTLEANEKIKLSLNDRVKEFEQVQSDLDTQIEHEQTRIKLGVIKDQWRNTFQPIYQNKVNDAMQINNCDIINSNIDSYVNEINEMVYLYSAHSRNKIMMAMTVNGVLIVFIIVVTIYSFVTTNNRVRKPIVSLLNDMKELSLNDDEVTRRLSNIDVNEIAEMSDYFNEMMYDQLTNAFTRKSGLAKLNRLTQFDDRSHLTLSLCFIDINGLKEVNDLLGHKYGDELIVTSVDCIKKEIRAEDFIVRMGGDEFLIVFNGIDAQTSEKVWQRINQRYGNINLEENRRYIISVSHGIVSFDTYEKSETEILIKSADDKMYTEKKYIKEDLKLQIVRR